MLPYKHVPSKEHKKELEELLKLALDYDDWNSAQEIREWIKDYNRKFEPPPRFSDEFYEVPGQVKANLN